MKFNNPKKRQNLAIGSSASIDQHKILFLTVPNSFMAEAVIYLLCKSMDWFLYDDNGLRHERVNPMCVARETNSVFLPGSPEAFFEGQ